jgi:hypothetical protein
MTTNIAIPDFNNPRIPTRWIQHHSLTVVEKPLES